jgi:tetratricopeptide (TPR) repeat protein
LGEGDQLMSQQGNLSDLLILARQCLASGKIEKAIEYFNQLIENDPNGREYHEGLANALFMKKEYDKAILSFSRVTQLNPKDFRAFINIGAVYNRKEDFQKAIEYLRRALSKNPNAAEAYYNLGISYRYYILWFLAEY